MMDDAEQKRKGNPLAFSLSTLFLVMTLLSVAIGLAIKYPLVGCVFIVISIPVAIHSKKIIQYRLSLGKKVTVLEKIAIFTRAFGMFTALLAFWFVSLVSCLAALCGATISEADSTSLDNTWWIVAFVLGVAGLCIAFYVSKKYERRYQQEIGKGRGAPSSTSSLREEVEQEITEGTEQ